MLLVATSDIRIKHRQLRRQYAFRRKQKSTAKEEPDGYSKSKQLHLISIKAA